jgi:hypothetical protein
MLSVLDLDPMLLSPAAVRPIAMFEDQPFQSHAAGGTKQIRPDLALFEVAQENSIRPPRCANTTCWLRSGATF